MPTVGTDENKFFEKLFKKRKKVTLVGAEVFKQEVLLSKDYSNEQKEYLFGLLEKGEHYSDIRKYADPSFDVATMKRMKVLYERAVQ